MAGSHDVSVLSFPLSILQFPHPAAAISFSHRYFRKLSYAFIHGHFGARSPRVCADIISFSASPVPPSQTFRAQTSLSGRMGRVTLFAGAWPEPATLSCLDGSYFCGAPRLSPSASCPGRRIRSRPPSRTAYSNHSDCICSSSAF